MEPEEKQAKILIIEDDLDLACMLEASFREQDYDVISVDWGSNGLITARAEKPDLIILDINLPDIDGFEVARRLENDRKTSSIPVIFLTDKNEREDRLHGLSLQAYDYITKPFDMEELHLRVRNSLHKARSVTLTHPVTGIPDGILVDEALNRWIADPDSSLLVVSLRNMNGFRNSYGFAACDDLLRASTLMIRSLLANYSGDEWFLGHLTGTDFVMICRMDERETFKGVLEERLEQVFQFFYREKDLDNSVGQDGGIKAEIWEYNFSGGDQPLELDRLRSSFINKNR